MRVIFHKPISIYTGGRVNVNGGPKQRPLPLPASLALLVTPKPKTK